MDDEQRLSTEALHIAKLGYDHQRLEIIALLRSRDKYKAEVEELVDALIWCSGSNDFNEGGVAREGWLKCCQPLIQRNMPRPVAEEKPVKHDFAVSPDGKDLSLVEREEASDAEG
jgi:hypothetical protein